jgi:hypothetical protein
LRFAVVTYTFMLVFIKACDTDVEENSPVHITYCTVSCREIPGTNPGSVNYCEERKTPPTDKIEFTQPSSSEQGVFPDVFYRTPYCSSERLG